MAELGATTVTHVDDPATSVGEEVLGGLLERSHNLHPDELAEVVRDHAQRIGATTARLYLVDLEQRVLVPLPLAHDEQPAEALDIDATLAGRAFRAQEPFQGEGDDFERRLWIPLLDGAERIGVMSVTLPTVDETGLRRFRWLASLAAQLIVSKSMYGDTLVLGRRRQQMRLAAEMRWAMLPPLTFASDFVEIAGVVEPAYDVAGDSFDYAVDGGTAHLAIFDAMGHGLEASRMANLAMATYRNGRRAGADLTATFVAIDAAVTASFGPEQFVTGQLAELNLASGMLAFVTGGHPLPILLRGTTIVGELTGDVCTPMGLGRAPVVSEIQLEPGDRVVFYTDGVVEARSPAGEEFGVARLGDLLGRAATAQELPAEMMRRLTHSVLAHDAGQLRDDATLLMVGWRRPMPPRQTVPDQ